MDRISNDRKLAAQYSPAVSRQEKTSSKPFGEMLADSVTKATPVLTPLSLGSATSTMNLKDDLNAALRAYGISVPPSLRMTPAAGGFKLDGDNRNAKFQAMLADRPDLRDGLNNLFGATKGERKTALDAAMLAFGGQTPNAAMSDFLQGFEDADQSTAFSIKFDGADAKVEEKGDKGWQAPQDKGSFMGALLDAYTKYMVTHQVSDVSDKDDPLAALADFQSKRNLPKTPAVN